MEKNPGGTSAAEAPARNDKDRTRKDSAWNSKRPTQQSIESSLMRLAVIAGLVFMVLGAVVALWIFVSYKP